MFIVQSFGKKTAGYLESVLEVLKINDFINLDVLFLNFYFATL